MPTLSPLAPGAKTLASLTPGSVGGPLYPADNLFPSDSLFPVDETRGIQPVSPGSKTLTHL